jgi:hypothetical protein
MSKFFAVVLSVLFLVATAVPLLATDARQAALAGTGNYIEDDYNIFTWYATLPSYSNTVWIGLNYNYDYYDGAVTAAAMGPSNNWAYMGASYGLGKEGKYGTLAMFYYDFAPGLNPAGFGWSGADVFTQSVDNKWTVLYAYPMEKMSLGLYFNRSDASYKYENETETTQEHRLAYTTLGAGVRFDLGDKAYTDIAFDYNMASYKDKNSSYGGYGVVSEDANKMLDVRGRLFYQWTETVTLVPYVEFGSFDFSLKADSAADWKANYYGDKGMMVKLGVGANLKINENNLLIFAIEPYAYYKTEPSDPPPGISVKATSTYLPTFRLALESDVRDWLTFRAGAYKDFYKDETKSSNSSTRTSETDTYIGTDFNFYMGLGFHVGDFDIDALVNPELPFQVGYWLTGYSDWNNYYYDVPVYMISSTYHF